MLLSELSRAHTTVDGEKALDGADAVLDNRKRVAPAAGFHVQSPTTLSWKDITYAVPVVDKQTKAVTNKKLLQRVDGFGS